MISRYEEATRTVYFGRGLLPHVSELLSDEFDGVFVISTERLASLVETVGRTLGARHAHTRIGATMHVPVTEVTSVIESFDATEARSVLAIGGGSAVGLGKAISRRREVPLAAIPTTYAGSEMTAVWGETRNGIKTTGRNAVVRPRQVLYDVSLTETMPTATSIASMFNALAHAMEALYAQDATPVSDAIARQAVAHLCVAANSLAVAKESDPDVGERALRGAWLAGHVLGNTTMSLHHKLCHVLGGTFNLPHADTHAVLLPKVLATCVDHAPETYAVFSDALGTSEPEKRLSDIACAAGVPTSLQELGVNRVQLEQLTTYLQGGDDQQVYDFDLARASSVLRDALQQR